MSITPIIPPQTPRGPQISPLQPAEPAQRAALASPPEKITAPALTRDWFGAPPAQSAPDGPPAPSTGNRVSFYTTIQGYYVALGEAIRRTREKLADFVYLAGWELDLDTFVDPDNVNPRQTLREVLSAACSHSVEVRVLLDSTANENSNRAVAQEVAKLGGGAIVDPFHKLTGSQHQKFAVIRNADGVVAFCGGCDIANARLGREGIGKAEDRSKLPPNRLAASWHDVQARVQGPAAADLWLSFVQRFREVAANRYPGTDIRGIPVYGAESLREPDDANRRTAGGEETVRVIRTYPNCRKRHLGDQIILPPFQVGYRFAPDGEMGIVKQLVQAIGMTERYIYLEDQYLVNSAPMQAMPAITAQLRATIEKDSFKSMIIAVAGTGTIQGELYQAATRRAEFIRQLGPKAQQKVKVYVYKGDLNSPYWFHSKTWVFDDEFAVVASANCNRRSYSCDSEIGVGVADRPSTNGRANFAHRLRMDLWLKHLNAKPHGASSSRTYNDDDVRDFQRAGVLWDKAPLLQLVHFDSGPEADLSINERFYSRYPKALDILKKTPASKYVSPYVGSRDFEWSLIDPDAS